MEWTNFFRECCLTIMLENSEKIGGNGVEVEIDESKFGKRKYYRGHQVEGQWVFGGSEKYNKRKVFMIPVANRKQETLIPIIQQWIHPGSIIDSDCWKSYNKLSKIGYTHVTVNHYGVHRGMHSGYLAEFMWRRKYMDDDKFLQLITDINDCFKQKYLQCSPTGSH